MIILYPILFLLLILKFYRWRHSTPLTFLIIIVYLFSSLAANYLYFFKVFDYDTYNISLHSVLYLFTCLSLLIYGFFKIEKKLPKIIKPLPFSSLKIGIWFLIILSLITIYDSIVKFNTVRFLSIEERRYGYNQGDLFENRSGNLMAYITQYGTLLYVISLFLFNYLFKYFPKKKLLILLLLLCSTTIIFSNIVIAGRDGIIKWILLLAGNYTLFSHKLSKPEKKRYVLMISLFLLPAIGIFMFTTKGRFGEEQSTVLNWIFSYYGQGFFNFSKIFDTFFNGTYYGRMTFPVFFNESVGIANLNNKFTNIKFDLNVFPTIIGSFYLDFGYWGTLIVTLIIFFFFKFIAFIKVNSIFYIILVLYLYQAIICGVFYFMDYTAPVQKIIGLMVVYIFMQKYPIISKRKFVAKRDSFYVIQKLRDL